VTPPELYRHIPDDRAVWHPGGTARTTLDTDDHGDQPVVRVLLGFEPEDLGMMPLTQAFDLADELGLDLREEDAGTVRIYDHGKLAYEKDAKHGEARRLIRRATRKNDSDSPSRG
jgi:hypothetical protein